MSTQAKSRTVSVDGHELKATVELAAAADSAAVTIASGGRSEVRDVRLLSRAPFTVLLVGTRVLRWALAPVGDELELSRGAERRRVSVVAAERKGAIAGARKKRQGHVTAPMPGRIVTIAVESGAAVNAGDVLLVIEAMKMQNEILAPAAGTVSKIAARAGDAVERGALLLELS